MGQMFLLKTLAACITSPIRGGWIIKEPSAFLSQQMRFEPFTCRTDLGLTDDATESH